MVAERAKGGGINEHNHAFYTALFISGKLTTHLEEVDRVATKMYGRLIEQLKERDGYSLVGKE